MKFRNGFVSNSSSASFIVKFTTSYPKEEIQKHLNIMLEGFRWIKNKKYDKLVFEKGIYSISSETSMFNDWYDITEWPFIRMLSEIDPSISGYHLKEIRQTESEYSDCDTIVKFDPKPWVVQWVEHHNSDQTNKQYAKDKKEAIERMREVEGQYLSYLYSMGLPVDDKLLLLDYKFSQ